MLDTQTKKRIDDCRDILVGKLPDPKAQIEQITIGIIYKFMDDMDKDAVELGAKAKFFADYKTPDPQFPNDRKKDKIVAFSKYAWDKLLSPKVSAAEMLTLYTEAIEGIAKNPNIPQLFRDIFKNAYLPYRSPETLKLFLKTIGGFEYTHSEKLGDAFEYLLSVMGSQGDAGQFRTPRHIIDFLVSIVDPDKGDTILDPACGTAGFLISAYKHILLKYTKGNKEKLNIFQYNQLAAKPFNNLGDLLTPDDRKKLIQNLTGYDISPDMVRLSLVNLYLHGFSSPNIHEYDTLSSEERWDESYDVILANPPFMSPKGGIRPHKRFTINSNRSEVLFADYIAEHLNPKGRSGIIVPEGIIFQSGTAYKELRKMLVEHHLYAVVSLPAGIFNPYSGVKTSILLMDSDLAKKRKEILFIKVDNDGFNLGAQRSAMKGSQLEEAIKLAHVFVHSDDYTEVVGSSSIGNAVSKAEVAKGGDFNLSGERYKRGQTLCSVYPLVELGQIIRLSSGTGLTSNNMEAGDYPVYGGNGITGWHSDYFIEKPTIVIGRVGAYCGSVHITKPRSWITDNGLYVTEYLRQDIDQDFLALMLRMLNLNRFAKVGGQPSISQTTVKEQRIPLPPLPVQKEIAAEIEGYQKIIDGAKAVISNYKPKIIIDPNWEMVALENVCDITSSKRIFKDEYVDSGVPFYRTKEIVELSKGLTPSLELFISADRYNEIKRNFSVPFEGDILVSAVGTLGVSWVVNHSQPFYFKDGNLVWIKELRGIDPAFLKQILDIFIPDQIHILSAGAAYQALTIAKLKKLQIPLPALDIQHEIVNQLVKEQALVNANKELIEIFQQKIKDRIAKVWGN